MQLVTSTLSQHYSAGAVGRSALGLRAARQRDQCPAAAAGGGGPAATEFFET